MFDFVQDCLIEHLGTIVRPAVVYGPYSYTWGLQEAILINQGKGVLIDGANNIVSTLIGIPGGVSIS